MADSTKLCSVCKNPKPTEDYWSSPYCATCHHKNWQYETEVYKKTMYPEPKTVHYTMCYICLQPFEYTYNPKDFMRSKLCNDCYIMSQSHIVKKKK